jgi:hypothetical protein
LVVNHLTAQVSKKNIGLACLYINHKETDSQTPENLLGGLLRQLLWKKPIPVAVHTSYEQHRTKKTKPTLNDLCSMLNSAIAQYSKVYFVVDALDEYPEDHCNSLIQSLIKLGPTSSVMITSRPNISVKSFFPDLQTLDILATDEDITHFITQQIASSVLSKSIEGRPELYDEIQATVSSNAKGMYVLIFSGHKIILKLFRGSCLQNSMLIPSKRNSMLRQFGRLSRIYPRVYRVLMMRP